MDDFDDTFDAVVRFCLIMSKLSMYKQCPGNIMTIVNAYSLMLHGFLLLFFTIFVVSEVDPTEHCILLI